jgi:hypothetical protein
MAGSVSWVRGRSRVLRSSQGNPLPVRWPSCQSCYLMNVARGGVCGGCLAPPQLHGCSWYIKTRIARATVCAAHMRNSYGRTVMPHILHHPAPGRPGRTALVAPSRVSLESICVSVLAVLALLQAQSIIRTGVPSCFETIASHSHRLYMLALPTVVFQRGMSGQV